MSERKRPEAPRAEKTLPGVWRLRLPLPWPGVPHGNAWAVAAGDGIVLFDTGIGGEGGFRRFDLALAQAGFSVEDVRLVACTHSHTDHYGLAAPIVDPYNNERLGLRLATTVDRTQFGVSWNAPLPSGEQALANEVSLTADLYFVREA